MRMTDPPTYLEVRARRRSFRDFSENDRSELDDLFREAEAETLGPSKADGMPLLSAQSVPVDVH